MKNIEVLEAIEVIRCNWPDERYLMLREALTKAITALENDARKGCSRCDEIMNGPFTKTFKFCPFCGNQLKE